MAPDPLGVLRRGLKDLRKHIQSRKKTLQSRLSQKQTISAEDSDWLDNHANFIDEERLLEELENASGYEQGLSRLSLAKQGAWKKLKEFAEGVKTSVPIPTASAKRKRPEKKPVVPEGKQPGKKKAVAPVFTKKENATLEQRIEILDWFHSNRKNQSKTAKHFDPIYPNLCLKQPLISSWVHNEAKWRADSQSHAGAAQKAKRLRQTQHPEVSEMLDLWVEQAMAQDLLLSGEARNGMREYKRHGEAASADPEAVQKEKERMKGIISKYGYQPRNIFNMDETGLFYA
ncbi:hypothetical protein DFH08DRAFT_911795 [Mycena albidolilacea]|uniref:Uncharacterized protein n=1 Tax=Mycena albidolilacea TaxID=1033008 RepID=A0AAD7ADZ2_9AGAR|nr:hypothetical protein DFH08DRAFT_911795 [Mycena albidolilacea]